MNISCVSLYSSSSDVFLHLSFDYVPFFPQVLCIGHSWGFFLLIGQARYFLSVRLFFVCVTWLLQRSLSEIYLFVLSYSRGLFLVSWLSSGQCQEPLIQCCTVSHISKVSQNACYGWLSYLFPFSLLVYRIPSEPSLKSLHCSWTIWGLTFHSFCSSQVTWCLWRQFQGIIHLWNEGPSRGSH